jgi:hypothetical protein
LVLDDQVRRYWDVTLNRVSHGGVGAAAEFRAHLTFRNISSESIPPPNPGLARLYAGSGRTFPNATTGAEPDTAAPRVDTEVAPNRRIDLELVFAKAPPLESLELLIPYRTGMVRAEATPGFFPEAVDPIFRAAASGGLQVAIYNFSDTGGEFAVRLGALNQGAVNLPAVGLRVVGLMESDRRSGTTASEHAGAMDDPPAMLYAGLEERRWVRFDRRLDGIRVEAPARDPVEIWF